MIKLIVTDLDGTLLNDEKQFAPDFFELLDNLNKQGIKFCAASGRSQYTIEKIFKPYEKDIFYISDNGGYIKGKNIEEVNFPLSYEQSKKTVEECLKTESLNVIVCAKDKAYFVRPNPSVINIVNEYYINYDIIEDYTNIKEQILKIAVYDELGSAVHGYPKVKNNLDKELIGVVSADNWFDIMNKNLNKGIAVKRLQKHFGITPEETMAFGDFNNDIEMLKCARYSFAMANSNDEVKKAANYIAESNNDFGVVKAIKEHLDF